MKGDMVDSKVGWTENCSDLERWEESKFVI